MVLLAGVRVVVVVAVVVVVIWADEIVIVYGRLFDDDVVSVRYRGIRRRDSDVGHVLVPRRGGVLRGRGVVTVVMVFVVVRLVAMSVMMMRDMLKLMDVVVIDSGDGDGGRRGLS